MVCYHFPLFPTDVNLVIHIFLLMLLPLFFSIFQQQCSIPYRGQGEQGSSPHLPQLQS